MRKHWEHYLILEGNLIFTVVAFSFVNLLNVQKQKSCWHSVLKNKLFKYLHFYYIIFKTLFVFFFVKYMVNRLPGIS